MRSKQPQRIRNSAGKPGVDHQTDDNAEPAERCKPDLVAIADCSRVARLGTLRPPFHRGHAGSSHNHPYFVCGHRHCGIEDGHSAVEHVESKVALAAHDGAHLATKHGDFLGAIQSLDPEGVPRS